MDWELLPIGQGLREHRTAWDELNDSRFEGNPLLSTDFIAPLAFHYGRHGDRMAVLRAGRQLGAAALLRPQALRWQALMPAQTQLAPVLLPEPGHASGLLASLPWQVGALALPGQDSRHLAASLLHGQHRNAQLTPCETTMQIDTVGDFDGYWRARSRNLRNDIRNKWNRLAREGIPFEFTVHRDAPAVAAAFERYAALESAGWKGELGTAIRIGTRQSAFFGDVLRRFAARRAARVFELRIGGKLAASELAIRGGTMVVLLKTTHDESLARYAPGLLLDQCVTRHAFEATGIDRLEYYTRASPVQLRWASAARPMVQLMLYRNRLACAAVAALRRLRHRRDAAALKDDGRVPDDVAAPALRP